MSAPHRRTMADRARRLAAALALIALLASLPALWQLAGRPHPDHVPAFRDVTTFLSQPMSDRTLVMTLLSLAAVWWFAFSVSVVVELAAWIRGADRAPRVRVLALAQPLARNLLAASLAVAVPAAPAAAAYATPYVVASAHVVEVPNGSLAVAGRATDVVTLAADDGTDVVRAERLRVYVVKAPRGGHHDTLWDAATRHLGDPRRYLEIIELNLGRVMVDGQVFTRNHRLIQPGWRLLMPADATGLPLATSSDLGRPPPLEAPPRQPPARRPPPAIDRAPSPSSSPAPRPAAPPVVHKTVSLPSGTVVAASFIAGLAVATTAGQLRRRWQYEPSPPQPAALPGPDPSRRRLRLPVRGTVTNDDVPAERDGVDAGLRAQVAPWLVTGMRTPTPARLPIGHRDGEPVELDLLSTGPITLAGHHLVDAARAIIATFLAQNGPLGARVVIPADTYDAVLTGIPPFPGLVRAGSIADALAQLEVERLRRARILDAADAADFQTYRAGGGEETMPAVLLVTDDIQGHAALYDATFHHGARFGLTGLHLGEAAPPGQASIRLDDHATVTEAADDLAAPQREVRMYTLAAEDAAEAFERLASTVSDPDELPAPTSGETEVAPEPPMTESLTTDPPIHVQLLGTYQVSVHGTPIRTGLLRTARELLAFYLLHPSGATSSTSIEMLWPDTPAKGADGRFRDALKSLRGALRDATGATELPVLQRDGEVYRIDPTSMDCDLWHVQAGLRAATQTTGADRIAALEIVVDHCHGPLLDGYTYDWIEPIREDLRRRVLDAISQLVEHHGSDGETTRTLALLERAIQLDPYAEHFYAQAMRIHVREGRPDAASRLLALLTKRLRELEVDPAPETCAIVETASAPAM